MATKKRIDSSRVTEFCDRIHRPFLSGGMLVASMMCWVHCSASTSADDFLLEQPKAYRVKVHQVQLQNHSTLDRLRGQVALELTVENLGDADFQLELSQMSAKCGENKNLTVMAGRQSPLVPTRSRTVPASESVTGWLMFPVVHSASTEPELELKLECHGQAVAIPLNKAIRITSNCEVRRLGPNNVLGVISLDRPVDGVSVWLLDGKFKQLKQDGVERVVVEYRSVQDTWAVSSNSISSNSVDSWLQSAIAAEQPVSLPFLNTVKSPVQFQKLFIVQPSTYRRPAYGFVHFRKPDMQAAIAAAVRDVFQSVTPDELEAAFVSPEAGIRQAAMETNLDRLTAERLQQIFDATTDDMAQQKLLARELYRSATPTALQLLSRLVKSDNTDVSQAAMSSIMRSAAADVVPLALELWEEYEGDPVWETDFVNAILKEDDYRMTAILAAYAEKRLLSMTATSIPEDDEEPVSADEPGPPEQTTVPFGANVIATSQAETKTLPLVLKFLQKQNDREFEEVAYRQVLKIADPGIQDDVLGYILENDSTGIRRLASAYLAQRLAQPESKIRGLTDEERDRLEQKYAPRSSRGYSKRYSTRFFMTAQRFPRSEYTDRLLELSDEKMLNSSSRSMAFTAALLGANSVQLGSILTDFRKLTRLRRSQVLSVLFQIRHPRRLEIAAENLDLSDDSAQDTLRQLQQETSLEASLLMVQHLDKARKTAERAAMLAGTLSVPIDRQVMSFTAGLYQVIHPDVQRFVNRLEKSPVIEFHRVGRQAKISRLLSSRSNTLRRQADQFRIDGQNDEAEEIFRKIIEADPFDDSAMTSLASLCMRSGNPEEAMELLQRAREISPEDIDNESFIALAMIRLGDVEGGLKHTKSTLNQVPDLPTSLRTNALYNSACSYSRAVEQVDEPDLKQTYKKEAFRYLRLSIERDEGFWEFEHALADPDLEPLHEEDEWPRIIDRMRARSDEGKQP